MVYFSNQKTPIWVNKGGPWNGKGLYSYFMAIWYRLRPFNTCYGPFIYFVVILVYFSRFGMLYQEKSGNPGVCDLADTRVSAIKTAIGRKKKKLFSLSFSLFWRRFQKIKRRWVINVGQTTFTKRFFCLRFFRRVRDVIGCRENDAFPATFGTS
jgi:hypothetical protein